jgi:hypothetical protein
MIWFSFLALVLASASAVGGGIQFPSPDGKWKVCYNSPPDGAKDQRAVIELLKAGGRSVELRRIDRVCDVLWSSDSSRIALTDRYASDMSDVLIYPLANPNACLSVAKLFPTNAIPAAERTGHCYFEAVRWLDAHRVRIRVSGHTDYPPPVYGFEHEYTFDARTGRFRSASKGMRFEPACCNP